MFQHCGVPPSKYPLLAAEFEWRHNLQGIDVYSNFTPNMDTNRQIDAPILSNSSGIRIRVGMPNPKKTRGRGGEGVVNSYGSVLSLWSLTAYRPYSQKALEKFSSRISPCFGHSFWFSPYHPKTLDPDQTKFGNGFNTGWGSIETTNLASVGRRLGIG